MIGRKKRSRIVFIDGIPIESAILEAGNSTTTKEDPTVSSDALKALEPRALFDKYDADGSGGIDVDEFKILLRDLHVQLSEPKALAYFKKCDKMRRGHISFEEFRLALYTCDPKNPNRTMGFAPGQALSPKDLFEMYDKDEQGAIDRSTFIEVLEFLGHKMPLDKMEGIFAVHEDSETEMMPYYQFKKVWLGLVDVRAELKNRQEKFSRFATHAALMKKLEVLVNEEEKQETRMLLEASTTLQEERIASYRRWLVAESLLLAKVALADAIDAAGQVYVFGKGAFGRFDGEPRKPDFVEFMDYEVVQDLWNARVRPSSETVAKTAEKTPQDETEKEQKEEQDEEEEEQDGSAQPRDKEHEVRRGMTRARRTLNAAARAFSGRQVSLATTFLWGKRICKVALGPAVAYTLTDSGEVFCWGGSKRQWRYFYDNATLEAATATKDHDNKDSLAPVTTRTEMLKQMMPSQVPSHQAQYDQLYLRQKYNHTFVKPDRPLPSDDQKRHKLQLLGQYFDILPMDEAAPQPAPAEPHEVSKKISDISKQTSKKVEEIRKKSKRMSLALEKKMANGKQQPCTSTQVEAMSHATATSTTDSTAAVGSIAVPAASTSLPVVATPPPLPARPRPTYQALLETVEPDLNVDDLVVSLELRGVHLAKQTRMELMDKLGDCLALEIDCVGFKFHLHMKDQDKAARRAKHDRQERKLQNILLKSTLLWNELRILQEQIVTMESSEFTKKEHEYLEMKRKIQKAKQKIKRQAREGYYDGSNPPSGDGDASLLHMSGLTTRGAPPRFFRGDQALLDISVGSRHALAVRQTGMLFTWGVGSFGRQGGVRQERDRERLGKPEREEEENARNGGGGGDDDIDAWHKDIHSPQVVSSLEELRFRSVCCGFGHSLALTTQGEVYVWGSATHGKLGIGPIPSSVKEAFTLTPLRLSVPGKSTVRVRKIACGPSHSALLTTDGALFVWGSGDGGKLGLGDGRDVGEDRVPRNGGQLKSIDVPTRVGGALAKEHCVDVSCGTAHTAVATAVVQTTDGDSDNSNSVSGGRVFVAGSIHALGKFTPEFTRLQLLQVDDNDSDGSVVPRAAASSIVVTRVSCGNAHTALVSHDGELLTWGNNAGGCTGHPIVEPFVKTPTRVSCLYQYPRNLCLPAPRSKTNACVTAYQSSQNASNMAEFALQKDDEGATNMVQPFAQTQQEMCPFWQVALISVSRIEKVVVVFKRSAAGSSGATGRSTQRPDDEDEMVPLTGKSSVSSSTQRSSVSSSSSSSSLSRSSRTPVSSSSAVKFVVLISEVPFDKEERGKYSVAKAKSHSIHTSFLLEQSNQTQNQNRWTWLVPVDTYGKFVRIQRENSMGMLSLGSVAVVGMPADEYNGPRVTDVSCAEGLTVAICRPLSSAEMVRDRFQRAVRADRNSLWILEQLETFHPFVRQALADEKVATTSSSGDEDDGATKKSTCVLCKPKERCVICLLDDATFAVEAQREARERQKDRDEQNRQKRDQEKKQQEDLLRQQQEMMRGGSGTSSRGGGGRADNKSREAEKRKAARDAKAKAAAAAATAGTATGTANGSVQMLKRSMTLEEKCQKLLALSMRTEEEEQEAEQRLAAELIAIDPLAAAAAAEKEKKTQQLIDQKQNQQKQKIQQLGNPSNQVKEGGDGQVNTTTTASSTQLVVKGPDNPKTRQSMLGRLVSLISLPSKPHALAS